MIIILDYGMGNLRSVSKALEHLGAEVRVSPDAADIGTADKLVLPGVGAFGDAAVELRRRGLFEPVRGFIRAGKPFLGICLGLQLLFASSEESPGAEGLGVVPGRVRLFHSKTVKIPHMGWNQIAIRRSDRLLEGVPEGSYFYFVHSYYAVPDDASAVLASCRYGEEEFPAIIQRDNIYAAQFHPEKSQKAGLRLLKNFLEL